MANLPDALQFVIVAAAFVAGWWARKYQHGRHCRRVNAPWDA